MEHDFLSLCGLETRAANFVHKRLPDGTDTKRALKELFLDIHGHAMSKFLDKETKSDRVVFSWNVIRPFLNTGVDDVYLSRSVAEISRLVDMITPDATSAFYMSYDMMAERGLARHPKGARLFEQIVGHALENNHMPLADAQALSRDVLAFLKSGQTGLEGNAYNRIRTHITNMAHNVLGYEPVICTAVAIAPPDRNKFTWPKAALAG